MFEIGFSEIVLVLIVGLVVLGPERLPVAIRTVTGWIRAMRSLASSVQNELTQELKLQELQNSLKKIEEQVSLQNISPEIKASMDELKSTAEEVHRQLHSTVDDAIDISEAKFVELEEDLALHSVSSNEETSSGNHLVDEKQHLPQDTSQKQKSDSGF